LPQKRFAPLVKSSRDKYLSWLLIAFFLVAVGLTSLPSLSAQTTTNSAVVEQVETFYRFHFAHDMGFTADAVKARAPWLSPVLQKICASYFARPGAPDEVPVVDGDPFTNSQEYPKSFQVGAPRVSASTASIPVSFQWADGRKRSVSVALVMQSRRWLIDDIRYPDGSSLRSLIVKKKP
jgi:hypothetical protein